MKAFLMYRDRDVDPAQPLPWNAQALIQDLELNTLLTAMALGDKLVFDVSKKTVLASLNDLDTIRYRQDILHDALRNAAVVRQMYSLATEAMERERKSWWGYFRSPGLILSRSVDVLQIFVDVLKRLRSLADEHAASFQSEGFTALFAMLKQELGDDYFTRAQDHLSRLKFRGGVLISAELAQGHKGVREVLRMPPAPRRRWFERFFSQGPPEYTFHLHPRDEAGGRALSELRDRGINLVANALAQSTDHINNFFAMLRAELAFSIGCVNLHEQLAKKGEPTCFPLPIAAGHRRHAFRGLYDVCLSLSLDRRVVGNDVNADHKDLAIITGANRGGKSTFLRSIGLAQLMMQCGMFAPAESFSANVASGLFTHYKREEDPTMKGGKFDEELSRMSEIADHVTPNALLLFNESFAATNEREGSEIARQIVTALREKHMKVFFVTHLYELARRFCDSGEEKAIFLRAERQPDRSRTFKLIRGEPLETTFGEDLYKKIFAPRTDLRLAGAEVGRRRVTAPRAIRRIRFVPRVDDGSPTEGNM
jgi:DNA mismatch repair ATPase MutS